MRAERRGRALWTGLELLIYGEAGLYQKSLTRMFKKLDDDKRNRTVAAKAYSIIAVGGQLDEETLINLTVRTLQRSWRKKRSAKLEAVHKRAESAATVAILGIHSFSKVQPKNLSRRRGREHMALVEKVAAHRILSFFRGPTYQHAKMERKQSAIEMQSKGRRYLATRRVDRWKADEVQTEKKHMMQVIAVKGAEKYARVIQQHFWAHRRTREAKLDAFDAQLRCYGAAVQADISGSRGGKAVLDAIQHVERPQLMKRRGIAIGAGQLPAAKAGSARPEPLTPQVTAATEAYLIEQLVTACSKSSSASRERRARRKRARSRRQAGCIGSRSARARAPLTCWPLPEAPALRVV